MKTIHSPECVSLLMENLWLRHKVGMKQRPNNVFIVKLPPPTEELAEARLKRKRLLVKTMNPKNFTEHGFDGYDPGRKV